MEFSRLIVKQVQTRKFDSRCANWNIFNEIESPLDIRSISNSLIPITGSDPYWSNTARDVFSGILTACYQAGRNTNDDIYKCCNLPAKDLSDFLARYKGTETATRHLAQDKAAFGFPDQLQRNFRHHPARIESVYRIGREARFVSPG